MQVLALAAVAALMAIGVTASQSPGAIHESASDQQQGARSGNTWTAAATGSGTACTAASPCPVAAALAKSGPGDAINLAAGSYPALTVASTGRLAGRETPVVLRPAGNGEVVLAGLEMKAPGIAVQGLTVRGTVYVHPSADGAILQNMHVDGSGVFLRASNSRLLDSLIENGSSIDGVQIKDGHDIVVQGNEIRYFDPLRGSLHADCIQLFDVQRVTIRGNTIHDCDNSSIIFSGGGGKGISDVLIESNFVMGCRVVGPKCRGGTAIDLREQSATNVVLRHNTFALGSVRINATPGQVNDHNVFDYLSSCSTPMTNSVVRRWNTGLCATPAALGTKGNRQGTGSFVDPGTVDLHVPSAQRASVTVTPVSVSFPSWVGEARDFDGQAFAATTAGADEPGGQLAPAGSTTTPTTPSQSGSAAPPPTEAPASPSPLTVTMAPVSTQTGTALLTATVGGGDAADVRFTVGYGLSAQATSSDGGRTWTLTVDVSRVPAGTYSVVAVATDASGNSVSSAPSEITVTH